VEFATNARAIGGFVRWMTRDIDSQQTDRPARVPLSGAQAAALLRIGGEPMCEAERADGVIVGAAAQGRVAPQAPAGRTAGRITLAVLGLAGFSVLVQVNSEQVPPNAPQSSGLVGRAPDTGASHIHDTLQGHHKMLNKITGVTAAAVVGIAATVAGAQSGAVQWKVEDGGNGHWYKLQLTGPVTWGNARTLAESVGGHLATSTSDSENSLLVSLAQRPDAWINDDYGNTGGPYLGGYQPDGSDASSAWKWVTGEPWNWTGWAAGEPNNGFQPGVLVTALLGYQPAGANYRGWADAYADGTSPLDPVQYPLLISCLVEWEADCNSDGIVDYGQCLNGTLADYNSNNIPDRCERGEACVVGNYPVQWQSSDSGNGHWYRFNPTHVNWEVTRSAAMAAGGNLACIGSQSENSFVRNLIPTGDAGYLGAIRTSNGSPGWQWVSGDVWNYTNWNPGEPNGVTVGEVVWLERDSGGWNDHAQANSIQGSIIEWSADCNNDNIVDYGQILQGQLTDSNTNGIPDICEQPQCQDADITNNQIIDGADLGAMLAFWGPVNPVLPQADINRDGDVNGADLGIVLSLWGPCP
jgi:hypothetical protein